MHIVINDHLGTPQMLVDENQHVVWKVNYDEFGKTTIQIEEVEFNQRFPGQYYDKETGLNYNYYRDYDASNGRYVQSDPIGLQGGINTYGYVGGNPVSYVDPYGLTPEGQAAGALVGGVVGGIIGGMLGGAGGTLALPGGGIIAGGAAGMGQGAVDGSVLGAVVGDAISDVIQMCSGGNCPPCTPYPVGDIGFQGPKISQQGIDKGVPHYILFQVEQIPSNCKCIWKEKTKSLVGAHHASAPMGVDLNGSSRPPNYPR